MGGGGRNVGAFGALALITPDPLLPASPPSRREKREWFKSGYPYLRNLHIYRRESPLSPVRSGGGREREGSGRVRAAPEGRPSVAQGFNPGRL